MLKRLKMNHLKDKFGVVRRNPYHVITRYVSVARIKFNFDCQNTTKTQFLAD